MGCFGGESEKTKLKRAKQREKAEKKRRQAQPWNEERQQNALSHRTRTHPATNAILYVDPKQMKPRTEAQNTYYVSRFRTDFEGKQKSMRHITKAEVLQGVTQGPSPGHTVIPGAAYPRIYFNEDRTEDGSNTKLLAEKPRGYYHEYPVHGAGESKHVRGPAFEWTQDHGRLTSPWRAITNGNRQLEGVLIHNHPQHPHDRGFHRPDTYYIGASQSDAQIQPGRFQRPTRSKTQATGFEMPFDRSRR